MSVQREHDGESMNDEHDGDGAHHGGERHGGGQGHQMKGMYLRFAAMILTAMVVMGTAARVGDI